MIPIKFLLPRKEKVIETSAGLSLLEAALANGVPLQHGCREGRCGRCCVVVKSAADSVSSPTRTEMETLGRQQIRAGKRLACQVRIHACSDQEIEVVQGSSELDAEELARSFDATFQVGREALVYLRQGLTEDTAQKIAEIIHQTAQVDAVAVTDTERVLGFSGMGCHYHYPGRPILTDATREVVESGCFLFVARSADLRCPVESCPCPIRAAVIAPMRCRGQVAGTIKLYLTRQGEVPLYLTRLAMGIAELLGMQMELAESDRQAQLVTSARLEALQAQIRPHFLFNVLNTIVMFSRTDMDKCRDLLIQLATFFRRSLSNRGAFITVQEELEFINTYLTLEQARFGEKIRVKVKIDPRVLHRRIPILVIQPLVENAISHGLALREEGGRLGIAARLVGNEVHFVIRDNGVGIPPERMDKIFLTGFGAGMGLGLSNVNDRLVNLYGEKYKLKIRSVPDRGTTVLVRVPVRETMADPVADGHEERLAARG